VSAALELEESLDLLDDFNPPCTILIEKWTQFSVLRIVTARTEVCDERATFVIRCRVCLTIGYACTGHAEAVAANKKAVCSACKSEAGPIVLFEFLPLGGR
jgi:hypothetical protein